MQLTLAEAQAAQLRQEKAQEEAAAAKRIDGECGVRCGHGGAAAVDSLRKESTDLILDKQMPLVISRGGWPAGGGASHGDAVEGRIGR